MTSVNRRMSVEDQSANHGRDSLSNAANSDLKEASRQKRKRVYRHRGILYIIVSAFCSSVHFILAKFVKDDMHVTQLSFLKFFLQFIIPIPFLIYRGVSVKPESCKVLALLIARGVIGTLGFTSFLYSFYFTRVGDATAVVFASPAFIGIGARIFLKEAFDIIDAILVAVVIGGIFLISQPPFLFGVDEGEVGLSSQVIGVLLAFACCLCLTINTLLMRKLGQLNVSALKIVFWYAFIGMLGTALLTTIFSAWSLVPCYTVRYVVVALGTLSSISQFLLTASLSLERSVFIAVLRANEIIFSYVLEYLIFGLSPNVWALVGVFVVLSATITASLKKMWLSKRKGIARRRSMAAKL